jgi:hypothetical protein
MMIPDGYDAEPFDELLGQHGASLPPMDDATFSLIKSMLPPAVLLSCTLGSLATIAFAPEGEFRVEQVACAVLKGGNELHAAGGGNPVDAAPWIMLVARLARMAGLEVKVPEGIEEQARACLAS